MEGERERTFQSMVASEHDDMSFLVTRPDDGDPMLTFSEDALHQVIDMLGLFVGARIVRQFERGGPGAKRLRLDLRVRLDDDAEMPDDADTVFTATMNAVDGQKRAVR